jgi:hypothetical protein
MTESSQILHSIHELPMLHKRLHGYEIDFYDSIELLDLILRRTGSIAIKEYLFKAKIENFELKLPCNVYSIEHVCLSQPLSFYTPFLYGSRESMLINYRVDQSGNIGIYNPDATNINDLGNPGIGTLYEVNKKVFTGPLGRLVDYTNEENHCLEFNFKDAEVDVLYSGTVVDEDGYPKLAEKTLEAVSYYLHYIEMRKKFYSKQADRGMLEESKQEKDRALAAARTPSSLSVNETNEILNGWTSFNRKRHNLQMRKF